MGKKNLRLSMDAHFDSRNGTIVLNSKDRKLKGEPFQLKLSSDSSSYETVFRALVGAGLVDPDGSLDAPKAAYVQSYDDLSIEDKDPRTSFAVGLLGEVERLQFDLRKAPGTLIGGYTGSGKSILQRNILSYAMGQEEIEAWGVDLTLVELGPLFHRPQDRLATTLRGAVELLENLQGELTRRYALMKREGFNHFEKVSGGKAIYLYLSEFASLIPSREVSNAEEEALKESAAALIASISLRGRAAMIYTFLDGRSDFNTLPGETKANLGRRIVLGRMSSQDAISVLGQPLSYGAAFLSVPGRGVCRVYSGPQELFQTYFGSLELMRSLLPSSEGKSDQPE